MDKKKGVEVLLFLNPQDEADGDEIEKLLKDAGLSFSATSSYSGVTTMEIGRVTIRGVKNIKKELEECVRIEKEKKREVYLFVDDDTVEGKEALGLLESEGIPFTKIPAEGMASTVQWGAQKWIAPLQFGEFIALYRESHPRESPQEKKVVYRVEKFVPSECPSCNTKFNMEGKEYIVMDPPGEGFTRSYDILICKWCGNKTARVMYEAREYILPDGADRKVQDEGFVNLHEVPSAHPRNSHITYSRGAISTQLELTDKERKALTIPEGALGRLKP